MAAPASGQPFLLAGLPSPTLAPSTTTTNNTNQPLDYSKILKPITLNNPMQQNPSEKRTVEPIPFKRASFLHWQPIFKFTEAEVDRMNVIEGLHYAVLGKLSYGWPELQELRRIVPVQYGIKGECNIGFFRDGLVLICLSLWEDYITLTLKNYFYVKAKDGYEYQIRSLIYDVKFKVGE